MQMPRLFLQTISGSCFARVRTHTRWMLWASRFVHVLASASIIFDDSYSSLSRRYRLKMLFFLPKAIAGPCASFLLPIWLVIFALGSIFEQYIFIFMRVLFGIESSGSIFLFVVFVFEKCNEWGKSVPSFDHSRRPQSVWSMKRAARGSVDLLFFLFALRYASMIQSSHSSQLKLFVDWLSRSLVDGLY